MMMIIDQNKYENIQLDVESARLIYEQGKKCPAAEDFISKSHYYKPLHLPVQKDLRTHNLITYAHYLIVNLTH